MAICQLMIQCFMDNLPNEYNGTKLYDEDNLRDGIDFMKWQKSLGLTCDLLHRFDLDEFIVWAKNQLDNWGYNESHS